MSDDDEASFLSAFDELGGAAVLGYPIGRRYTAEDVIYQPFQMMLLTWDADQGKARPAPLLDVLHDKGLDGKLKERFRIPGVSIRKTKDIPVNQLLQEFYEEYGSESVFGRATSELEGSTPFSVQRFQDAVLQIWTADVKNMPSKGSVVPVTVGTYAREFGVYPQEALVPEMPGKGRLGRRVARYAADDIVRRGDPSQPYIYLTIDDCWDPLQVETALDIAAKEDIRLTFFPIGNILSDAPELWQRAVAEGHEIENHTQTHRWLDGLPEEQIVWEIQAQHTTLEEVLGSSYEQHFLRPPGGRGIFNYDPRILRICRQLGYKVAMWSADSRGYRFYPRTDSYALSQTLQNVLGALSDGAIVLQHALDTDIAVLPDIVDAAKEQGLAPITMTDGME
ncbi:MAG: polysaccharide deacetylase family protein [Chloroflexi bacterium]|nr:polysaccharide deacetylase family protein [Chloroflexota bacterium]